MRRAFDVFAPVNLSFGEGKLHLLANQASQQNQHHVALLCSKTVAKSDNFAAFEIALQEAKLRWDVSIVSGEPTVQSVDEMSSAIANTKADVVIGLGGGSVLDTAKAAAVMVPLWRKGGKPSVQEYLEGVGTKKAPETRMPLYLAPTTAGTGSEATTNAVISQVGPSGFKKSLRHSAYAPDYVVIDPLLAIGLPKKQTAASGMDALTQLLEAYVSVRTNCFIQSLALKAIELLGKALHTILTTEADTVELRSDAAYGAYISGIAIANAGLGYVHGLAGPMGALHHIPHGVACGMLTSPINKALKEVASSDSSFLLDMNTVGQRWNADPFEFLAELTDLADFPSLASYGFSDEQLVQLSKHNVKRDSPLELSEATLLRILQEL
ncbi:MAG: iron-containing alcohol dehydrogenase [Sphaerochaetaceae bacterium]